MGRVVRIVSHPPVRHSPGSIAGSPVRMKKRPSRKKAAARPKNTPESKAAAHPDSAQPGPSRELGEGTSASLTLSTKQKVL